MAKLTFPLNIFGGGGTITPGTTPVSGGTDGGVFYQSGQTITNGSNLIFSSSAMILQVGSGSTTAQGWYLGYLGSTGFSGLWTTAVTRDATNFNIAASSTLLLLNAATSTTFRIANAGVATIDANMLQMSPAKSISLAAVVMTRTAPSVASGFGTSPSISANNGTAAFTLTIGSSTTGVTTGTITMPAATTGWVCSCQNVTNPGTFVVGQTGGSTTTITLTNYSRTTGLAVDFTAADVIRILAAGY